MSVLPSRPASATVRARVTVPITVAGRTVNARATTFTGLADHEEHLALTFGTDLPTEEVPLVRVHSECLTGDLFGSRRCDCGPQLDEALAALARRGGHLIYLRQEGRGIGLYAKLDAYVLQDRGLDTYAANRALGYDEDGRDYQDAAEMLLALGASRIDLLTGNPEKVAALERAGVTIRTVVPMIPHLTAENSRYLAAKRDRGHR